MKTIIDSVDYVGGSTHVIFSTPNGKGKAVWEGSKPNVGESYDVEIDIDETLTWNEDIHASNDSEQSIVEHNGINILKAKLIAVEDDGCLTLDFTGTIIFVEVSGSIDCSTGETLTLHVTRLSLYPINL